MSERGERLARRLEEANAQVIAFAQECPTEVWTAPCVNDGRTVAAVVRHVGGAYSAHMRLIQAIAAGESIPPPFTDWAIIHQGNAASAEKYAHADRDETIASCRRNGGNLATAIRALPDDALDRTAIVSIFRDDPMSAAWVIEHITVPHPLGHLADLRVTIAGMA